MKITNDAVERWAEAWKDNEIRNLTKEEAEAFATCVLNAKSIDEDEELRKALESKTMNSAGLAGVLWVRIKAIHTYRITQSVALFMSFLLKNFGDSTMYANYFQYWAYRHGKSLLTISDFANIFPLGVPTEKAMEKLWARQKIDISDRKKYGVGMDNILDIPCCMETIKTIGDGKEK